MDYQSSHNSHRTRSNTNSPLHESTSSSVYSRTSETPSIRYFTSLTDTERPYISPYTHNDDLPGPAASATSHSQARFAYDSSSRSSSPYPSSHIGRQPSPLNMSTSKSMSSASKENYIRSLQTHRVNTLTELRRIEKLFAHENSKEVTEAMTTGWAHYVNSNNLLSELRGMTKNYPFSSECLDEAKWKVIGDPSSTRSWNYCWLILTKIKTESLIKKHARQLAAKPAMWGGKNPNAAGIEKLASACTAEWSKALENMLRQWSTPPNTPGKK